MLLQVSGLHWVSASEVSRLHFWGLFQLESGNERMQLLVQVSGLHLASAGAGAGQIQRLSLGAALQHIIHQEGFRALWKGNGVTIIHRMPYSAANFWAYESITRAWQHKWPATRPHEDIVRRLCAGGLAGMTACSLVSAHLFPFSETPPPLSPRHFFPPQLLGH